MPTDPSARGKTPRSRPLVSAIIPTYNRASTLSTTLESAIDQTYDDLEVIVVDDGSTDATRELLSTFPDIIGVHQENSGVASARNAGIERSKGSIIMFLDSDDLWFPETVQTQVDLLEASGPETPAAMCNLTLRSEDGTDVTMFTERKLHPQQPEGLWLNVQDVLATRFLFTNQTLAIRRQALDTVGWFDEGLWVMEDFDLAMRLSTLAPWAYTTKTLGVRLEGSFNSLTASANRDRERLSTTIVTITSKLQDEGIPRSRVARNAIGRMKRRAERELQLAGPMSRPRRAIVESRTFVDERLMARVYRNSWRFPKLESSSL